MRACVAVLLVMLLLDGAARAAALPGVAAQGEDAQAFAPPGWAVESTLAGDLNGDATPDLVVVLLQVERDGGAQRERALLWLHGAPSGYVLRASNTGLLACWRCLGMKGGDAAPELEVAGRVLSVAQWGGSRFTSGTVHRFRLEKDTVRLIGTERTEVDSATGASTNVSENLLTGARVEEHEPAVADEDGKPSGKKKKTRTTRGKKGPLPLLQDVTR